MLSNAIFYRLPAGLSLMDVMLDNALQSATFTPCGPTQERSSGWVPPRGEEHGALVESIGGQYILRLMTESKAVPSSVIARKVKERAVEIEAATGRKPGKKETKELKEEMLLSLLPMAFAKQSTCTVWIDPAARLLVVDAASQSRADEVVSALVRAVDGFSLTLLQTVWSPVSAMAQWLSSQDAPVGFSVDRECELKASDESKAVVKYGNHSLDIAEVQQHIAHGKLPTRLAMTFDGRVSFVLTDSMQVKKIQILDVAVGGTEGPDAQDRFDADVAIVTGELARLIPALVEALGGEMVIAESVGADETSAPPTFMGDAENDPMYEQALQVVAKNKRASISLVQRHLRIGYNRAARLIERMEADGKVSAMDAGGSRTVLAA